MRKLLSTVLLIIGNICFAQTSSVQDSMINKQFEELILTEQQRQGLSSPLYNGTMHTDYATTITGTAYYLSPDWIVGSVYFENALYPRVNVKYDLVSDQLVVKRPDGFGINLYSPRVTAFYISDAKFIYLDGKQFNGVIASGFYQQMQEGKVNLLYKRYKKINEKITNKVEQQFMDVIKFYIIKDQEIHEVKSLSSVLAALNDHRKELKDFLRANQLKYRKNSERVLNKMIAYYNQLHS